MRVQSLFIDSERNIIMDKEAQDHEFTEKDTALESRGETPDNRRSPKNRQYSKRSTDITRIGVNLYANNRQHYPMNKLSKSEIC